MSDPRGHDHLPDPAALDELLRAFADPADSDPAATIDGARVAGASDETSGPPPSGDEQRNAPGDDAEPGEHAEPDGDEERGRGDEPDRADEHAGDAGPDGDLEHDDHDDHDDLLILDSDADPDGPAERDASVDPEPTPPPLIRIDDYAGSVAVARDAPVAPTQPAGSARGVDDAGDDADADADPSSVVISIDDAAEDPSSVVISIDDADLPDPVYVEGSLDRDGSRSIVIIEDDDTGDSMVPESERDVRRGIEPRMRERRVAVRRAQGRKRLKWVALVSVIVFVVVGTLAVLGSPLFAIREDRVTITGNVYADPVAVQAVIDDLVGTPALRADTQRAERDLEAIPWVDSARVRVDFPHSASIEIREREAWTTYQGPDQQFRVLDRDGRVLDVLDGYPFAYVLITGPDPVDLDPGEFAPRGYAAASGLAKNLTGSVRTRVDSIQVTADGSRLSLLLDDGTEVLFGEARDLFAKLVRLETVLTSGEEREPGLIDVSTREVTVPPGGSGQDEG